MRHLRVQCRTLEALPRRLSPYLIRPRVSNCRCGLAVGPRARMLRSRAGHLRHVCAPPRKFDKTAHREAVAVLHANSVLSFAYISLSSVAPDIFMTAIIKLSGRSEVWSRSSLKFFLVQNRI